MENASYLKDFEQNKFYLGIYGEKKGITEARCLYSIWILNIQSNNLEDFHNFTLKISCQSVKMRPNRVRRLCNYIIDHVNCSIKYWFWLILANFGKFWLILVYFGPFWPILVMLVDFGWFWPIFAYFSPFWANFSLSWAIFAIFCLFCQFRLILDIFGWFWAILKKFQRQADGQTDRRTDIPGIEATAFRAWPKKINMAWEESLGPANQIWGLRTLMTSAAFHTPLTFIFESNIDIVFNKIPF